MDLQKRDELKAQCTGFLKANDLTLRSLGGRRAVHAFWYGACCALGDSDTPWVTLCLLSGRYEELVDEVQLR